MPASRARSPRGVFGVFQDFEELLASLNDANVKYLIGGAHALALHARPRATKDLDLFIDPTKTNARRLISALTVFFGTAPPQATSPSTLSWIRMSSFSLG
jgi:hypothetical protein